MKQQNNDGICVYYKNLKCSFLRTSHTKYKRRLTYRNNAMKLWTEPYIHYDIMDRIQQQRGKKQKNNKNYTLNTRKNKNKNGNTPAKANSVQHFVQEKYVCVYDTHVQLYVYIQQTQFERALQLNCRYGEFFSTHRTAK